MMLAFATRLQRHVLLGSLGFIEYLNIVKIMGMVCELAGEPEQHRTVNQDMRSEKLHRLG